MATERVQKILAQAGIASRRKAEELIVEGLVTVNGKLAKLGDKADLSKDSIKVKGKLIRGTEPPVYLAFHKPRGVISMLVDPEGRPTLSDYLEKVKGRVFPIGRLDYNSQGLILLTNDGDFAEKLQKREDIPRVYRIKIKGHPTHEEIERLRKGTKIDGRWIEPHQVNVASELKSKSQIEIVLLGTGAVDIKGFVERKGFLVETMTRTAIGHITIKGLLPGQYRWLKKSQVEALLKQPELGMRALEAGETRSDQIIERQTRIRVRSEERPERGRPKPNRGPRDRDSRDRKPRASAPAPRSPQRAPSKRPSRY